MSNPSDIVRTTLEQWLAEEREKFSVVIPGSYPPGIYPHASWARLWHIVTNLVTKDHEADR